MQVCALVKLLPVLRPVPQPLLLFTVLVAVGHKLGYQYGMMQLQYSHDKEGTEIAESLSVVLVVCIVTVIIYCY